MVIEKFLSIVRNRGSRSKYLHIVKYSLASLGMNDCLLLKTVSNMLWKISDFNIFWNFYEDIIVGVSFSVKLNFIALNMATLKIYRYCYWCKVSLRKKCPYSQLFWIECWKIRTRITSNKDTLQVGYWYKVLVFFVGIVGWPWSLYFTYFAIIKFFYLVSLFPCVVVCIARLT